MAEVIEKPAAKIDPARVMQMVDKARWAASAYATYPRDAVLRIVAAVAKAAEAEAGRYARWAVEETGFGVVEHKELKNRLCSQGLYDHYSGANFTDHVVEADTKTVAIPKPAGVIFALTPSTNPVCSVFYTAIIALLTPDLWRN